MLYLSYNNRGHTDGAGAQIQRILSIYMVSKFYTQMTGVKIGYIHNPIYKLDYQGLQYLESNTSSDNLHEQYNNIIELPSDSINGNFIEIAEQYLTHQLIINNYMPRQNIILKCTFAHTVLDFASNIHNIPVHLPWISKCISSPINIAVHIRRGELFVVESNRMLPNSYYVECMKTLSSILDDEGMAHTFHIYTEVPTKQVTVTPSHHGILNRITDSIIIKPEDNHLEDFLCFNNIIYHINECPVKTLQELTNSDILLASRSSFSYVAAILKKKGAVLFHPFWHSLSPSWITVYSSTDIINSKDRIIKSLK